jgi:hypothetical protein
MLYNMGFKPHVIEHLIIIYGVILFSLKESKKDKILF